MTYHQKLLEQYARLRYQEVFGKETRRLQQETFCDLEQNKKPRTKRIKKN